MSEKAAKKIRLIYGIILSVFLVISAIALILSCAHIYLTGDQTYTPEKIAAYFSLIAIPLYICLGLIAGRFLLEWVLPKDGKQKLPPIPAHMRLNRAKSKVIHTGPVLQADIEAEQKLRNTRRWILIAVLAVCFGVFLLYALNPTHFTENINGSVIRGVVMLLTCLLIPFILALCTLYMNTASMEKEIELRKQAESKETIPADSKSNRPIFIARIAITLLAVALVVIGLMGQGTMDVLTKAINICTECIGLG